MPLYLSRTAQYVIYIFALIVLSSCQPDGFINKVKYEDNKYLNTCQSFQEEVQQWVAANRSSLMLPVSQQNHTELDFFFLEKGQFEIIHDTLYLRLREDLNYRHYLDEEVAIEVRPTLMPGEELLKFEEARRDTLPSLLVDLAYVEANQRGPYLLHKFPLQGRNLAGYQMSLSLAIVARGETEASPYYFCESDAAPLGKLSLNCCEESLWRGVELPLVSAAPRLEPEAQTFVYAGFTGTVDVLFRPNSTDIEDDSTFSVMQVQRFIDKYGEARYAVDKMALYGFASPTGRASYNQILSQNRAESLKEGLALLNVDLNRDNIITRGYGEDWHRVRKMIPYSSLDSVQQAKVMEISTDTTLSDDQREYALKRLSYYPQIKEEILGPARHTLATLRFAYDGVLPTVEAYRDRIPLASPELWRIANEVIVVRPYEEAENPLTEYQLLDNVLTRTASPELYALRADYHFRMGQVQKGLDDLEIASRFRGPESEAYSRIIESYRLENITGLPSREQMELWADYEKQYQADSSDLDLLAGLALMRTRLGWLNGAEEAYSISGVDQTNAGWYNNKGVVAFRSFRLEEAQRAFEFANQLEPDLAEPYFNLAALYAYRGKPLLALSYLDLAVELDPNLKTNIFNNPLFSVVSEDLRFDKYRSELE